ncbi:MAG TPA: hypothetical protein VGO78_26315, partial [Acidimicrobiales bacterium]|nr:hypothetical protein [Acidimicrobiales bacterium]
RTGAGRDPGPAVEPVWGLRNPLRMLRHPWVAFRELRTMVRRGRGQMRASVRRTRRGRGRSGGHVGSPTQVSVG